MADKFILGFPISEKTALSELYQDGSNIGIGTDRPDAPLDITKEASGTSFVSYLELNQTFTVANSKYGILFKNTEYGWDQAKISVERQGVNANFDLVLSSAINGALEEGMRINYLGDVTIPNGKLGVGISTTPSSQLVVETNENIGTAYFRNTSSTASTDIYAVNDSSHGIRIFTYGSGYVGGSIGSVGANGTAIFGATSSSEFVLGQYYSNDFSLMTNNTKRLTIDSSGNVLIGTTSNSGVDIFRVNKNGVSNYSTINITNDNSTAVVYMGVGGSAVADTKLRNNAYFLNTGNSDMLFGTNSQERMRIDSSGVVTAKGAKLEVQTGNDVCVKIGDYGNGTDGQILLYNSSGTVGTFLNGDANEENFIAGDLLIGKSTANITATGIEIHREGYVNFTRSAGVAAQFNRTGTDGTVINILNDGTTVGSISFSGSTTSYNITSDYRLKTDLKDFSGTEMLSSIKMYDFAWKESGERSYGVMAHELQEVLPQAVTGEKDGEEMQAVDYSKIVPVLVKALQEANERIEYLESKIK